MMGKFRKVVDDLLLNDVALNGRAYTWSNDRLNCTLSRIDRVLGSVEWHSLFPNCFLQGVSSGISDHCPLLLSTALQTHKCKRFRFESFWVHKDGFQEVVAEAWNKTEEDFKGNAIAVFNCKLQRTARALQSWSAKNFGEIKEQIVWANTIIGCLDQEEERRTLSFQERWLRRELKKKLQGLCVVERTMARQRSRQLWLTEGDANTSFFHLHASHRRRKNYIGSIQDEDRAVASQ